MTASVTPGRALRYAGGSARGLLHHHPGHCLRVFPNEASLERLVSAVLVEIDDRWAADAKAYIKWECQDA
jgi:hypothetical protein